mmetsp:Transcript_11224/g.33190  ORF Transcript_11224/g.33190 Transcript_11224/m.33190 type:complete len:272 (+) Transcript_11224:482-1297(+)
MVVGLHESRRLGVLRSLTQLLHHDVPQELDPPVVFGVPGQHLVDVHLSRPLTGLRLGLRRLQGCGGPGDSRSSFIRGYGRRRWCRCWFVARSPLRLPIGADHHFQVLDLHRLGLRLLVEEDLPRVLLLGVLPQTALRTVHGGAREPHQPNHHARFHLHARCRRLCGGGSGHLSAADLGPLRRRLLSFFRVGLQIGHVAGLGRFGGVAPLGPLEAEGLGGGEEPHHLAPRDRARVLPVDRGKDVVCLHAVLAQLRARLDGEHVRRVARHDEA